MERVKLPKEVAEAIEYLKKEDFADSDLIRVGTGDKERAYEAEDIIYGWCSCYNLLRFVGALVNGYEVEETPADKVREMFREEGESDKNGSPHASWILTGALRILDIYNIKIEGVND